MRTRWGTTKAGADLRGTIAVFDMGSFRLRLIIAFVALFTAISVTVSFLGMMLREQQIVNLFDDQLAIRADKLTEEVKKLSNSDRLNDVTVANLIAHLSQDVYTRDLFLQVYKPDGTTSVCKSPNLRGSSIAITREFNDTAGDDAVKVRPLVGGVSPQHGMTKVRSIRKRFTEGDDHGGGGYIAVIASDAAEMTGEIDTLRLLFFGANIAGLLAAAGAAWVITGAMTRRIEAIKTQVQTLGPDELSRRIQTVKHDEISELAVHLNAMLDRLKAGFETQERFIHDASHELKTPVATIQAEAQALMLGEPTHDELMGFVHGTNDEMRRLGRLTEALLLLTRGNDARAATRFRVTDMTEIAMTAIRHLSALATDHKIRLNLVQPEQGEALLIRCDPDLLEAMISNLVRNAIRFSPQRSEVKITLSAHDGLAELLVEDAGPGIPTDILPRIFDRYFETSQTRVRRGAGLGLAIALTVVNLHGGSISASNRAPHGACFTVRLPLLRPAKAEVLSIKQV